MFLCGFSGRDPKSEREYRNGCLTPSTRLANTGDACGLAWQSKGRIPAGDRARVSRPRRGVDLEEEQKKKKRNRRKEKERSKEIRALGEKRCEGFSLLHAFAIAAIRKELAETTAIAYCNTFDGDKSFGYPAQPMNNPHTVYVCGRAHGWNTVRHQRQIISSLLHAGTINLLRLPLLTVSHRLIPLFLGLGFFPTRPLFYHIPIFLAFIPLIEL